METTSPSSKTATNTDSHLEGPTQHDKFAHHEAYGSFSGRSRTTSTTHQHIWFITGPAGCGKSTVAQYLASSLKLPYLEGDNFHPEVNVKKMHDGEPLTDTDRWDWLTNLRNAAVKTLRGEKVHVPNPDADESSTNYAKEHPQTGNTLPDGVVVTCSALKRKYRDVLRVAGYDPVPDEHQDGNPQDHGKHEPKEHDLNEHDKHDSIRIHFVYLHADEEVLVQRVEGRKGHYMGKEMVHSQFAILELPAEDERDCITIRVDGTKDEVEHEALLRVELRVGILVGQDAVPMEAETGDIE